MSNRRLLKTTLGILLPFALTDRALALNSYVPIRQVVSQGSYRPSNYLSLVSAAVGREDAYRMFSSAVKDRYPHIVGRFGKDESLVHALRSSRPQRRLLLGLYAEERFVEANRDSGWRKVADRFAPQRDVWRRVDGRIQYAQIKVHGLSASTTTLRDLAGVYLDSMRKDSGHGQASLFLVPDDHVDAIRGLIAERHGIAVRNGDTKEALWLMKQKDRVNPLGINYDTLSGEAEAAQSAGRGRIVARYAGPIITVSFLALSAGCDTYRWSSGEISGNELAVQLGKTGSAVSLGLATSYLASRSEWLMARPYRVGGLVSAVVLLTEEGWLIHQHGGFRSAFSSPGFYVNTGGNLGGTSLGLIGAIELGKLGAGIGSSFGPWGTFIGGGVGAVVGGTLGGMAGYLGGASLTDWMIETLAPSFYYAMKVAELERAESRFSSGIRRLEELSRPLVKFAP